MKYLNVFTRRFPLSVVSFLSLAFTAAAQLNYDTAWTLVYDGGKMSNGSTVYDYYYDVKSLPDGGCVSVGESGDSTSSLAQVLVMKFDGGGLHGRSCINKQIVMCSYILWLLQKTEILSSEEGVLVLHL